MKRISALLMLLLLLAAPMGAAASAGLPDGEYRVDVALSGGTGRACVESPALLRVRGGACSAVVVWSSPFYAYMRIGETEYRPIQEEGNATFEIPVILDADMPVTACTVAMSEAHEIEYTLRFDSSSAKPAGSGNAAVYIAAGAAALAALSGAALVVRRKRSASV